MKKLLKTGLVSAALVIVLGSLAGVAVLGLPGKSRVKNARPTPAFTIPPKVAGQPYLYFIALGDQGTGDAAQNVVARRMNQKAARDSLHFVLLLGDNFYPRGAKSEHDPRWKAKFEKPYDLPFLRVPFFATLGNHDWVSDRARHQIAYSRINPRWVMPSNYYTFTKKIGDGATAQFFALDTDPIVSQKPGWKKQLLWLETQLQNSTATWKIVFGHHPVFSYGRHGHQMILIEKLRPLLEAYHVDAYFAGHDHDRQLLQPVNGVYYIVSGTGAKSRSTRYGRSTIFAATDLGFVWCRLSPEQFHLQFINRSGRVEYAHTWKKGEVPLRPYIAADWQK